MIQLAGWEGPRCVRDGLYRYSKTISWIRLYIEVDGSEIRGGITGTPEDFEIALEGGQWKRFQADLACTPEGELILILRDYESLETVVRKVGDGVSVDEEIASIEDVASYLERCVSKAK